MSARLTAIVVHWRSSTFIEHCLLALAAQDVPLDLIIVDNDGDAAARASLTRQFPQVRWLGDGRNRGFAAANNLAIRACTSEFVLLVNPDVVLAPDYARLLLAEMDRCPDAGSATGIGTVPGTDPPLLDGMGHFLNRDRTTSGYRRNDAAERATGAARFGVCAGYALYRRTALDTVALDGEVFDETLFVYYEDVDLDWRLQRAGWQARYVPTAQAAHARGSSGGMRDRDIAVIHAANRWLVWLKNDPQPCAVRDRALLRDALQADVARWRAQGILLPVLRRLLACAPAMLRQRRAMLARARRSETQLAEWLA